MAVNKAGTSKDRTSNFTKEETAKLSLLLQDYPLITSKKTDHASNGQKEMAWRSLAEKFNSDAVVYRNTKQLQQKFNNMKKTARKEMSAERSARRQTGGGPPPTAPSQTTEWLNSIMKESISGLPAIFDSDASGNTTADTLNSTAAAIVLDIITDEEKPFEKNDDQNSKFTVESEAKQQVPQDADLSIIFETEADKDDYDLVFDTSTPRAMLRKPISKQLLNTNRRKKAFTPLETRKKIINHIDYKMECLSQKCTRGETLLKYAHEEHIQLLAGRKEIQMKQMSILEDQQRQQQELHVLELEFKKKLHDSLLHKTRVEIEK